MRTAYLLRLAVVIGAGVMGSAKPAGAAYISIVGVGPTPLGQAISVDIDGAIYLAYGADVSRPLIFGAYEAQYAGVDYIPNGPRAAWIVENYGSLPGVGLAVQLALWDVVNEGGNGLATGSVSAPPGIREFGDLIIAASVGQSSVNATILFLSTVPGIAWQPLISSYLPPPEVPEPATWMMVAAALLAGNCYTRRK
jgi:hypothetical protein